MLAYHGTAFPPDLKYLSEYLGETSPWWTDIYEIKYRCVFMLLLDYYLISHNG